AAPLPMVEPDFSFLILEAPLDAPSRECYPQQRCNHRFRGRVAEEVLDFTGPRVAADQQVVRSRRETFFCRDEHERMLDAPDDRALVWIFDAPGLPALLAQDRMRLRQFLHGSRLRAAGQQPWPAARPSLPVIRTFRDPRRLDPRGARLVNFADEFLPALVQC